VGYLVNIDNGGTLTDICVVDGDRVLRTKTLTTPHDLSRCLLDGLTKASRALFGRDDLVGLLSGTDHLRYSTTQGTNALVERKGPGLGLLLSGSLQHSALGGSAHGVGLLDALVGDRHLRVDTSLESEALQTTVIQAVNALAASGASRIVIAHGGADRALHEIRVKNIVLRAFPQHLLGAVPVLYSHEVVVDDNDVRRTWTSLFNAFLHPAMERFLYSAEHRLRDCKAQNPLLIFRNDGHSSRVARTTALKTYGSGPRGGMEGARAVAAHYGFEHLLTMDIGGTTTDIGEVRGTAVRADRYGRVEGVEVSFPLCDVVSVGVGGSSVLRAVDGAITVGPDSVGGAPGPACFGLGGTEATITDAFLVSGLLDPGSFFDGQMSLDLARAREAVGERIAKPMGKSIEAAALAMEQAWISKVAHHLRHYARITPDTVLAAFGGAGPLAVCRIADEAGISSVLIPAMAAVFSAYGLGFSDIAHEYEAPIGARDRAGLEAIMSEVLGRARDGMYGEGFELEHCQVACALRVRSTSGDQFIPLRENALPDALPSGADLAVTLTIARALPQPPLRGRSAGILMPATCSGLRRVSGPEGVRELPIFRAEEQVSGAGATGPAVLEEAYFTSRIDDGWRFDVNDNNDIMLRRA
jgi:N-methylhydantoinase A